MKTDFIKAGLIAGALALCGAPLALAASGDTSGPASGKPVTPGAAAQKQASTQSGSAAGAPGVEGKQGAESGSPPKTQSPGMNKPQQ